MVRRYPQAEIDRIKTEISIEQLVEASGIELKRRGADLHGLCPFHDDHHPAFIVTPKKNVSHCMACTKKGGSVIDWVMQTRCISFPRAMELLKAEHPSLSTKLDHVVRVGTTRTPFEFIRGFLAVEHAGDLDGVAFIAEEDAVVLSAEAE
jgi:hypothetical protein